MKFQLSDLKEVVWLVPPMKLVRFFTRTKACSSVSNLSLSWGPLIITVCDVSVSFVLDLCDPMSEQLLPTLSISVDQADQTAHVLLLVPGQEVCLELLGKRSDLSDRG